MEETTEAPPDWIDMGAWVGRQQAFAVIAKKCSAAQALSLKQMKESCAYEKFGLSWEDFCQQQAGISRVQTDRIIGQYDEFGEAYFRLSSLARISPENHREIAGLVVDNCIEIDGRQIAIIPENASIIRGFIRECRAKRAGPKAGPSIPDLELRLHALIQDVKQHLRPNLPVTLASYLKNTAYTAIREWGRIARRLEEIAPRDL